MKLKIAVLEKNHVRNKFESSSILLNNYIIKQASQDVKRDLSACFVLLINDSDIVKGYYTLSSSSINRDDLPEELVKKLPPAYTDLPTILLGRLAIDKSVQGKRLGEYLLMSALEKCLSISTNLGTIAIIVDPIDQEAQAFYSKYGFILLPTSGKMFLPIKTIKRLFGD